MKKIILLSLYITLLGVFKVQSAELPRVTGTLPAQLKEEYEPKQEAAPKLFEIYPYARITFMNKTSYPLSLKIYKVGLPTFLPRVIAPDKSYPPQDEDLVNLNKLSKYTLAYQDAKLAAPADITAATIKNELAKKDSDTMKIFIEPSRTRLGFHALQPRFDVLAGESGLKRGELEEFVTIEKVLPTQEEAKILFGVLGVTPNAKPEEILGLSQNYYNELLQSKKPSELGRQEPGKKSFTAYSDEFNALVKRRIEQFTTMDVEKRLRDKGVIAPARKLRDILKSAHEQINEKRGVN